MVRQPDRPGDVRTRAAPPHAGPGDGVPGAARPVGVRGSGAGLGWKTLVPLFRHATIRRIDQVYEFRLDRKRLAGSSANTAPGEELREVFRALEPLPASVADLLTTKPKVGGQVSIRWCSALVKPASPEVLAVIREHPQLKGYLEPGAPPGYLLLKSRSNPNNFVRRCQELGFDVNTL